MKKDPKISLIRMICTSMVVLLHIFQQFEVFSPAYNYLTDWLNLGLVMFFSVSAYLYSCRTITSIPKWYLHRYVEIAVPSIIVGFCTMIVFYFKEGITAELAFSTLLSCAGLQVYAPKPWMFIQLWFLTYILFFYFTVPFIQKINCKKCNDLCFWSVFVGILTFVQGSTIVIEQITKIELLSVGILLRLYLPYFLFKRYEINGKPIRRIMYVLTGISVLAITVTCLLRYRFTSVFPDALTELIFIYTQSVAGTVLFYWLYQAFSKLSSYPWILAASDMLSYEIYLTHCLFIGYSTSLILLFHHQWYGVLLALAATIASSIALHYISSPVKKFLTGEIIFKVKVR